MADTIEVTDFPLGYKWNNVYCILTYMSYITLYTPIPFLLWKDYRDSYYLRNVHENTKTNFVKDPRTIPPFLYNIKRYWSVHYGY
jgi:hypothetical protein